MHVFNCLSLEDLTLRWAIYHVKKAEIALTAEMESLRASLKAWKDPAERPPITTKIQDIIKIVYLWRVHEIKSFTDLENWPELVLCILYQIKMCKLTKVFRKTLPGN